MKRALFTLMFVLVLISCTKISPEPESVDEKYSYPILPGSPKWKAFTTGQQMVDACQIPESVLKSLTTRALLETCVDYPLWLNYIAYDYFNNGILSVINRFNGLTELSRRIDMPGVIIDFYATFKVPAATSWTSTSTDYLFHLSYFEMFMSADCFITKFTADELLSLKPKLWQNIFDRIMDSEHNSIMSFVQGLHLYAKIIKLQNGQVYLDNKLLIDSVASICTIDQYYFQMYVDFANLISGDYPYQTQSEIGF